MTDLVLTGDQGTDADAATKARIKARYERRLLEIFR